MKSCPKSNKSPNLVTLLPTHIHRIVGTTFCATNQGNFKCKTIVVIFNISVAVVSLSVFCGLDRSNDFELRWG